MASGNGAHRVVEERWVERAQEGKKGSKMDIEDGKAKQGDSKVGRVDTHSWGFPDCMALPNQNTALHFGLQPRSLGARS